MNTYQVPGIWHLAPSPEIEGHAYCQYLLDGGAPSANTFYDSYSRPGATVVNNTLMILTPIADAEWNVFGVAFSTVPINVSMNGDTVGFTYNPENIQSSTFISASDSAPPTPSTRFLARMEALSNGTPIALIAMTSDLPPGNTTFYTLPITFNGDSSAPTVGNSLQPLSIPNAPTGPVHDFTTACVDDLVIMFWVEKTAAINNTGGNVVSYSVYDGSNNTASAVQTLALSPALTATQYIHSIDATCILVADSLGNQSSQIVLVALVQDTTQIDNGNNGIFLVSAQTTVETSDGVVTLAQVANPFPLPMAPAIPTINDTVRICWGNLQYNNGTNYSNAMVVTWSVYNGDPYFTSQMLDTFTEVKSFNGYGPTYTTAISLDAESYGQTHGWQDMRPTGYVIGDAEYEVTLASDVSEQVMFPFVVTSDGGNISYYVGFIQNITCLDYIGWFSGNGAFSEMILQLFPSFNFTPPAPDSFSSVNTAYDSGPIPWGTADVNTALSSWMLLANISGLPPYFSSQPSTSPITLQFGTSETNSITVSASTEAALKLSGSIGPVHGAVTAATKSTHDYTSSITVAVENIWKGCGLQDNGDVQTGYLSPAYGMLIYLCPYYYYNNFEIKSIPSGDSTGLNISIIYPGNGPSGNNTIATYYYNITSPNTPITDDCLIVAMSQFPETSSEMSWPASNSIDTTSSAWASLPPALNPYATPANGAYLPDAIAPNSAETVIETITFSDTGSYKTEGSIEVSVGTEVSALAGAFKFGATGTIKFSNSVAVTAGSSQSISIIYPSLPVPDEMLTLQPYFLYANPSTQAPWVPNANSTQTPWLLTWTASVETDAEAKKIS
ncbi:MAG: hypothetical protein ACXV8O_17990 [Methylobacter sp.]